MKLKQMLGKVSVGAILLSSMSLAHAVCSAPIGWYLELNGGSTSISNVSYPGDSSSSGIGANANLGYKFMTYFATELGYSQFANTSVKTSGVQVGTIKHYSYDIAGKAIVPMGVTGLEFFAKLGVVKVNSSTNISNQALASSINFGNASHTVIGPYMGLGAQFYFYPQFAINGQWARSQGNSSTGNLDLYSLGVSFIFN
jgi:hypothetical protein